MINTFNPSLLLKNNHIQTLYASLFRRAHFEHIKLEDFILKDGDFVEIAWYNKPSNNSKRPIVILFHGLAGSYKSVYITNMMEALERSGFDSVVMHFRGAGKKENLLPKAYHSGATTEAIEFMEELHTSFASAKLFAIGFSIGGNMLLDLIAQQKGNSLLSAAVSVSAPMQLDICANQMDKGFSKFYQFILLKKLKETLQKKFEKHDMSQLLELKKSEIKTLKNFWDFDGAYTAPIHGFKSAQEYYEKCSAKQFLIGIDTPTLIIHAKDDPFTSEEVIPREDEISCKVTLEVYERGGHMGFVNGSFFKPEYWLEERVINYFIANLHQT